MTESTVDKWRQWKLPIKQTSFTQLLGTGQLFYIIWNLIMD